VGFEPTVSAGERSQTYALDRAATGTRVCRQVLSKIHRAHTHTHTHKYITLQNVDLRIKLHIMLFVYVCKEGCHIQCQQ
jgi:hypothetical protein